MAANISSSGSSAAGGAYIITIRRGVAAAKKVAIKRYHYQAATAARNENEKYRQNKRFTEDHRRNSIEENSGASRRGALCGRAACLNRHLRKTRLATK